MVQHLPSFGWQPVVLTAREDTFSAKDESLMNAANPDLKVFRAKGFEPFNAYRAFLGKKKDELLVASETISQTDRRVRHRLAIWIRMNVFVPDARIGWYWNAVKEGRGILRHGGAERIVSIGPPHTTLLVGKKLSAEFGIPHVPVFIDPWVDIAYYKGFRRSRLTELLDRRLERSVIEQAADIIFVTRSMKEDYDARFPGIQEKSRVLYWGYDEDAFPEVPMKRSSGPEVLLHAGNIFDFQNPTKLWATLRREIERGRDLKIEFVGTVGPGIRRAIDDAGLGSVATFKGFLPYKQMIGEISHAAYLLVCATEKRHVPGKLFEYVRAGKPILAFGDDNKEVQDILRSAKAGFLFPYSEDGAEFFRKVGTLRPDTKVVSRFERRAIAADLAAILSHTPSPIPAITPSKG